MLDILGSRNGIACFARFNMTSEVGDGLVVTNDEVKD